MNDFCSNDDTISNSIGVETKRRRLENLTKESTINKKKSLEKNALKKKKTRVIKKTATFSHKRKRMKKNEKEEKKKNKNDKNDEKK